MPCGHSTTTGDSQPRSPPTAPVYFARPLQGNQRGRAAAGVRDPHGDGAAEYSQGAAGALGRQIIVNKALLWVQCWRHPQACQMQHAAGAGSVRRRAPAATSLHSHTHPFMHTHPACMLQILTEGAENRHPQLFFCKVSDPHCALGVAYAWLHLAVEHMRPVPAGCCCWTGQGTLKGGEVASNQGHTVARDKQATKLHCGWLRLIAIWPLRVWAPLLQDPSSVSESASHRRGASGLPGRS